MSDKNYGRITAVRFKERVELGYVGNSTDWSIDTGGGFKVEEYDGGLVFTRLNEDGVDKGKISRLRVPDSNIAFVHYVEDPGKEQAVPGRKGGKDAVTE